VGPFGRATPFGCVERVSGEDHHRHAIGPGIEDRHRRMLDSDTAVDHRAHGLACGLGVAVCHRHRRLLVHAGEELGFAVAAVVDQRFVQAPEARARIRRDVLEVERLDDVDHEVGPGTLDDDVAGMRLLRLLVFLPALR